MLPEAHLGVLPPIPAGPGRAATRTAWSPYFSVPATGIEDLSDPIRKWPFNDPDYNLFPVLNLAVGGSGGGDPASGSYPAEMLIDWVRVF